MEVHWVDSYLNTLDSVELDADPTASKFGTLALCKDVGYLLRKNKREIVLAVSCSEADNQARIANTIPRGWVKKIIYLHPAPPEQNQPEPPNVHKTD